MKNTTANPGVGNFNAAGRGFPDVSAHSHKFYIIMSGRVRSVNSRAVRSAGGALSDYTTHICSLSSAQCAVPMGFFYACSTE